MRKLGGRWITTNDLALQWFKENIELFTKSYNHSILIKEGIRLR
ncbi:MAG: hypothetical protein NZ893_03235 [Candidatus Aenigmarchaeota archaeon]|nr:hypothetical protein [Candidatus Aenigmarchaeota archaeon]